MFEEVIKIGEKTSVIQEIALKLVEEQNKGKTTAINKYFDREDAVRPTLALDYSYGRRSAGPHQIRKQILHMWELGSLENSKELIGVPLQQNVTNFAAILMLDLSEPKQLWHDLEKSCHSLRAACAEQIKLNEQVYQERAMERVKKDHKDLPSSEFMPFPVLLVGGKYDVFMDFDPEVKKHICHCMRAVAHLIGGSVLFYSTKIPKLVKTLCDTINHLAFGSPANPFRSPYTTDYHSALCIWFGKDSWEEISNGHIMSMEQIGATLTLKVSQTPQNISALVDPANDEGFRESVIDEMRVQKFKELESVVKNLQLSNQFESVGDDERI